MHVFSAIATLSIESRRHSKSSTAYMEDIKQGKDFLQLIESENAVARKALDILLEFDGL